jgi:hypothetical protein
MKFADECQSRAVPAAEASDFVASVAAIADENEGSFGEADEQQS